MGVPTSGKFLMFGTGSVHTIQGALVKGGGDGSDIVYFSGSAHNIGRSNINKYDPDFSGPISSLADISESLQWRGYPLKNTFNFTMKCVFKQSQSIADPDPDPDASGSVICLDNYYHNVVGFSDGSVGNITGSNGNGDTTYPVSSSYDINSLTFTTSLNRLYLQITTGSDSSDPPTFTSLTVSSSYGEDTLDYCDLYQSSSTSTGLFNYSWNSTDVSDHFVADNCITISFNTASVDYFTDCFPAIETSLATRTVGNIPQNKQQSCDAVTIANIYFSSSDLDNGITVGDYVYTDSDGRNPFNGESKYWGINTSSAPNLNSVPDKICQIVSNGLITAISDCTPTPAPVLPTASVTYDCDTTSNNNIISLTTASYAGNTYLVYNISGDSEVTQSFGYSGLSDRPNKFTAFDSSGSYDDPIYTTGWVGDATYTNTGGQSQWSTPLSATSSGSIQIKWKSSTGRKIQIDYGRANPDSLESDSAVWCLVCSGSLKNLQIATGSSIIGACRSGSIGDSNHYHYHPTSSFSSARVYNDNDGLDHVTSSAEYFSYTSSAGTRYYYRVQTGNFGEITSHAQCPGTEIAAVHLGNASEDCDDSIPSAYSNRVYISPNWSGFTLSNSVLKVDNDAFTISDQFEQDIYDNDSSHVIHEDSISFQSISLGSSASSYTFLVAEHSLKNPSGTKILATVDSTSTPSTITFTPCSSPPGGSGCTEFDASQGFYDNSFSGNNPVTAGMCSTEYPGALFISMAGLIPQTGDSVHTSAACSGAINAPNTYYTIYNGTMNKTFVIKMNADGDEINQVWECGSSDTPSSGSSTYYLSTSFTDYGDNCGQDYIVSNAVTSDAPSIALGLHYTVYDNGVRFNGRNKYYIVKTSSQTASGNSGQSHRFWQIDSNGVVQDVALQTCGGSGGSE